MVSENTPQEQLEVPNPNLGPTSKQKIVVIMGATGSGKSKLAIDLASHFPIEIINADSMQVYKGILGSGGRVMHFLRFTGLPHHLLGTISPAVEFTAKDFRDYAIPLIHEICSRNCLPVIVDGTNYYIKALVTRFLLDDNAEDLEANCLSDVPGDEEEPDFQLEPPSENCDYTYNRLKDLDPVAANRIHPNDQRKIKQYLSLYSPSRILPSKLFQGDTMQGTVAGLIISDTIAVLSVDASLPALDQYVDQRVDLMVSAGLLEELRDVYEFDADYTRGLRQAIGVQEFEDFLSYWNAEIQQFTVCPEAFYDSNGEDRLKLMLGEAIEKVKLNTRRLVRCQRREGLVGFRCCLDGTYILWKSQVAFHMRIKQYISLYSPSRILPSKLFQGHTMQITVAGLIISDTIAVLSVDASLPALDQYVDQRVDLMVSAGLLEELRDVYEFDADYTRGLRQAIGVQECEDFLSYWNAEIQQSTVCPEAFYDSNGEDRLKLMLGEAIEKVKLNTRRLVRCQKRRLGRLQMLFGWNIHFVEVTGDSELDHLWAVNVVEPSSNIIHSFLDNDTNFKVTTSSKENRFAQRDLWTRYVCQGHVAIRSLEVHMNGNNINRGVAIVNEFRV
ncbi:hypothetical protein OROGR_022128 [Orobanche gracilis]